MTGEAFGREYRPMKFLRTAALTALICASLFAGACSSEDASPKEPEKGTIGLDYEGEPEISYVLNRYISDPETRSIYEVFTGEETNYGKLVLRTQPDKRAGMYFFVMFGYEPDDIVLACTFELSVDSTGDAKTRTYKFTVPETHSVTREIALGVTGSDWPWPKARVNAWKLVLKSPSGKILAQKQSWLWEHSGAEKSANSGGKK